MQTTLNGLVQQHAQTFFAQVDAATGAGLPQFVKYEFDALRECGILAHGFLRLRCADEPGAATNSTCSGGALAWPRNAPL